MSISQRTVLFLLTLTLPSLLAGQNKVSKMDSLGLQLELAGSESERAYVRLEMAKISYGLDSVTAFDYSKNAIEVFRREQDSFGLGKAYSALGGVYFDYGEMYSAQQNIEKSKAIFELLMQKDSTPDLIREWTLSTLNLASSLGNQGMDNEEIRYLLELAPVAERYNDYRTNAILHTNLGITALNRENYEKAYDYFNGNDALYEKTNAYNQFSTDRLMYVFSLIQLDSLSTANRVLKKTEAILDKIPDAPQWQMYHQIWGDYFVADKNYTEALKRYDISSEIIADKKMYYKTAQMNLNYAEVYRLMGDNKKHKAFMLKFYNGQKGVNASLELLGLRELAKLEEDEGNLEKSLDYINKYLILNDSVRLEELTAETNRLEKQFENEKKERQILELQNRNSQTALSLEKNKSQNYLLFFLLGAAGLLLLAGYLLYRNRQKKAALTEQKQEQQIQTLKSDQERKLFGVMMEGVEQERKRLAADLHDGLGGRLSGISIKLSQLSAENDAPDVNGQIDDILYNLDDSLQELRGVARNLMPETLLKYGLKAALEDYCSTLKDRNTNIVLQFYSTEKIADNNKALMIYRIIQELINNAIKHSKANEILVQYFHDVEKIDITVEDDGIGFDPERMQNKSGLGLTNLRNRVDFLGGKMDIRSALKEGTSVNIQIDQL